MIFRAQVIAYGAYCAIKHLYGVVLECLVVSSLDNNPNEIDGVRVATKDTIAKDKLIIVGVTELVQKEVVPQLKERGYNNLFVLTQHEEFELMSSY